MRSKNSWKNGNCIFMCNIIMNVFYKYYNSIIILFYATNPTMAMQEAYLQTWITLMNKHSTKVRSEAFEHICMLFLPVTVKSVDHSDLFFLPCLILWDICWFLLHKYVTEKWSFLTSVFWIVQFKHVAFYLSELSFII